MVIAAVTDKSTSCSGSSSGSSEAVAVLVWVEMVAAVVGVVVVVVLRVLRVLVVLVFVVWSSRSRSYPSSISTLASCCKQDGDGWGAGPAPPRLGFRVPTILRHLWLSWFGGPTHEGSCPNHTSRRGQTVRYGLRMRHGLCSESVYIGVEQPHLGRRIEGEFFS